MKIYILTKRMYILSVLILLLIIPVYSIKGVDANPVPFTFDFLDMGTTLSLAQNVSMPTADVDILISSTRSSLLYDERTYIPGFNYTIEMNANFQIVSEISQNACIAFVYPETWGRWNEQDTTFLDMQIRLNETPMPYIVADVDDVLDYMLELNLTEETSQLFDLNYAVINASLIEGCVYNLDVEAIIHVSLYYDIFSFFYWVRSARTWDGTTHESVEISVENSDIIRNVTFFPEDSFTETSIGVRKTGTWALEFPSFDYDLVGVSIEQFGNEEATFYYLPILILASPFIAGIILIIVHANKKRKK